MAEETRTCSNCACHAWHDKKTGQKVEGGAVDAVIMCHRNPPQGRPMRVQQPVMTMVDGHPRAVKDAKGHPRVHEVEMIVMGYHAVGPEEVCYDGWRPLGTLPGALRGP